MDKVKPIIFLVQGSAKIPYRVTFWREGNDFKSACTCPAGKKGTYCKHRFALLDADITNLVSDNYDDLAKIPDLLKGSDVDEIYGTFSILKKYEKIFKNINALLKSNFTPQEISPEISVVDVLKNQGFILKQGKECQVYNATFEYLGSEYLTLPQLKKKYPDLLNYFRDSIKADVWTYSQEVIDGISKYNANEVKEINALMLKAMR